MSRRRPRVPGSTRLIPVPSLAKGPAPTLDQLRAMGARMARVKARDVPAGVVAQVDQAHAIEAEFTPRMQAIAAADDQLRNLLIEGPAQAAPRIAVTIAMLRAVEARCAHISWPPPANSPPITVVLTARAATCPRPACQQALRRRWHDDGRCELCEQSSDSFMPFIAPVGPCVVSIELCDRCAAFMQEGAA